MLHGMKYWIAADDSWKISLPYHNGGETCIRISNIRRTLVDIKIVHHSYVVGASPTGAALTTSSFST